MIDPVKGSATLGAMRDLLLAAALAAPLSLWLGCGDDESCTPNEEVACECDDGEEGTRYCLSNRTYDDCYCAGSEGWGPSAPTVSKRDAGRGDDPEPTWPPFDAGSIIDSILRDAGMDTGAPAPSDGRLLLAGQGQLIDIFARGTDVWVVVPNRVARISLDDGSELAHWDAPRPLLTAAFDGERLAVLDGAKATLLELNELKSQLSTNLVEPCMSAVLMAGGPLVCAPNTFNGGVYVIDPVSGAQQSSTRALRGGKLVAIPGTRRLLAMDSMISTTAQVFEIDADAGALSVLDAGSQTSSAVAISAPVAFDGTPARNLVTRQGVLVRTDSTCSTTSSEPCLARTGTLGLLQAQEAFLAMDTVSDGLFGLLDPTNGSGFSSPRCSAQPCRLLNIDVTAREIRVEQAVRRPLRNVIALHVLPEQKAAVMGVGAVGNEKYYSSSTDAGYEVVRVDIKASE
jgi:hypothetical protein